MNKLKIKALEIQNFRSIRDKTTLIINPGLFTIEGMNLDEPGNQNGAGKTTLVAALYWVLTGNALTNEELADDVINIKSAKDCKVTVTIEAEQGEIKITRTRKHPEFGNNLFLEINGQDLSCHKIADTQVRINDVIKIPFDLLHSTIIMTSDIKSAFSSLTMQQRVQLLESIRDYSIWDRVRDEANKDIKLYNKDIQRNNISISNLEGQLSTYTSVLEESVNKLEKEIINLKNINVDNEDVLNKELDQFKIKKEEISNKIIEIRNKTSDLSDKYKDLNNIVEEANIKKAEIQKLSFDKTTLENKLVEVNELLLEDTCPTCKQKVTKDLDAINLYKDKIDNIKLEISKVVSETSNKEEETQILRKNWLGLNNEIKEIVDSEKLFSEELTSLTNQLNNVDVKIEYLQKEIWTIINNKKTIEDNISSLNSDIIKYQDKIEKTTSEKEIITENNKQISYKKTISDYYYRLLGNKGELRPYLLNNDINYLNTRINKYTVNFFTNTDIQLRLEGAAIKIIINSGSIQKTVSSLSGGEVKRLNFIIQLALYDLLQIASTISFNTLWLDEVESQLDTVGCQQLINLIEDKSNDIESVFWITNNQTVSSSIPDKIICKKSFGETEIITK